MNTKVMVITGGVCIALAVGAYFLFQNRSPDLTADQQTAEMEAMATTTGTKSAETVLRARTAIKDSICYGTDGQSVYLSTNLDDAAFSNAIKLDADLASFKVLNEATYVCLAKDDHSVFNGDTTLPVADPLTFQIIEAFSKEGETKFMKDKFNLYKFIDENGTLQIIPNGDPATFRTIPSVRSTGNGSPQYAYDKNQFYCYGNVNTEIDGATAVVVPIKGEGGYVYEDYIQDKNGKYVNCVKQ